MLFQRTSERSADQRLIDRFKFLFGNAHERPSLRRVVMMAGVLGLGVALLSNLNRISHLSLISSVLAAYIPPPFFSSPEIFVLGGVPTYVAVGGLNQDGHLDLVVVNSAGNGQVLLGDGNGNFKAAGIFAAGTGPTSVVVGDVNGDGLPDLLVANSDNNVSVLLGNGDGTFRPAVTYPVDGPPKALVLREPW